MGLLGQFSVTFNTHGPNIKLKKVNAVPPHRGLNDPVQLPQGGGRGHQHASPDHRTDPQKPRFELKNFRRYRHRGNMSDHPENAIAPHFGVLSQLETEVRRFGNLECPQALVLEPDNAILRERKKAEVIPRPLRKSDREKETYPNSQIVTSPSLNRKYSTSTSESVPSEPPDTVTIFAAVLVSVKSARLPSYKA